MIAKKSPKANLEKKRFAFFQIGLLVAGSLCLLAFEYSTTKVYDKNVAFQEEIPTLDVDIPPNFIEPVEQPKKVQKLMTLDIDSVNIVDKLPDDGEAKIIDKYDDKIVIPEGTGGGDDMIFTELIPETDIVEVPDVEPEFPGGEVAMHEFIRDHIELPNEIYEQGTIYVQFVVNEDGSIEQVEIPRGLSPELNKSAKKVVKKMPRWKAGEQMGRKVRVRFTLPIRISTGY